MGYFIFSVYILLMIYAFVKSNKKELIVFYDNGDMFFVLMTILFVTIASIYIFSMNDSTSLQIFVMALFAALLLYNSYIVAMYNNGLGNVFVALIARVTLSLLFAISLAEVLIGKNNTRQHNAFYALLAALSAVAASILVYDKKFSNPFAYFRLEHIKSLKQSLADAKMLNLK